MADSKGSVLITGASTGIGRTTALHLDALGFRVFAGVRKRGHAEQLDEEGSDRLEPVILDVTDEGTIEVTRDRIEQVTGGRLDGLVNNAGIGKGGPLEYTAIEDWRAQLEVNVIGQVAVTKAFLPMIRPVPGRIVFIGSIAGRVAVPYMAPYAASKHAIEAIGDSLRREMRPFGVEVSIVEPGSIATDIWDKAREETTSIRQALGDEGTAVYGKAVERFSDLAEEAAAEGIPAEEVAKVIEHALTASKPKTRYLVGKDAKQRAFVKRLVSDRRMDSLVARQIGI